jgi:hypothetical protein
LQKWDSEAVTEFLISAADGRFAQYASEKYGVQVAGITVSKK